LAEIRSREDKPLPGIEFSEILIPDEDNIGSGTFITVLEPQAMAKINPIMSTIINKPVFQMIVSINAAEGEVTVLLGKADNSPAISRKTFRMPPKFDVSRPHRFDTFFEGWKIKGMKMNGDDMITAAT